MSDSTAVMGTQGTIEPCTMMHTSLKFGLLAPRYAIIRGYNPVVVLNLQVSEDRRPRLLVQFARQDTKLHSKVHEGNLNYKKIKTPSTHLGEGTLACDSARLSAHQPPSHWHTPGVLHGNRALGGWQRSTQSPRTWERTLTTGC
jgi:hypothetical protein